MPPHGSTLYLLRALCGGAMRRLPRIQHRVRGLARQLLREQRQRLVFGGHEPAVGEHAALGGQWTADLSKSSEWITKGHSGKPKLTIRAGAKDFIALVKGEKNAQMAVMSGDLSLEPMDLDLAMKLGPLFS